MELVGLASLSMAAILINENFKNIFKLISSWVVARYVIKL